MKLWMLNYVEIKNDINHANCWYIFNFVALRCCCMIFCLQNDKYVLQHIFKT